MVGAWNSPDSCNIPGIQDSDLPSQEGSSARVNSIPDQGLCIYWNGHPPALQSPAPHPPGGPISPHAGSCEFPAVCAAGTLNCFSSLVPPQDGH